MIQTTSTYHIKVRGEVDEDTFNQRSPLRMKVIQVYQDAVLFTISTDQSGLIGVIRFLHGQGFVFLSIQRHTDESTTRKEDLTNACINL